MPSEYFFLIESNDGGAPRCKLQSIAIKILGACG
jgi:hypothetical protein